MGFPISGVVTSLTTPFSSHLADGSSTTDPDLFHFETSLRWQARSGVSAVAIAGAAGEGWALTREERHALIGLASDCRGPMAVLAHVAHPSTAQAIMLSRDAEDAGADAVVLGLPHYNKPGFRGLCAHVEAVGESSRLPLLLEIDPARTGIALGFAEIAALIRLPRVGGLVDHSAHPLHVEWAGAARGAFVFLPAHEASAPGAALLGADGLFSTLSNVVPGEMVALWNACRDGDGDGARDLGARLQPLLRVVEAEGVPAIKHAVRSLTGAEPTVRLPLHALVPAQEQMVDEALGGLASIEPLAALRRKVGAR